MDASFSFRFVESSRGYEDVGHVRESRRYFVTLYFLSSLLFSHTHF